jgi:hypothetical protein
MTMHSRVLFLIGLVTLLLGSGCSLVHVVPLAAREGDTIMIALGSPDDMDESKITSITYTPTGGSAIVIPNTSIRAIFNLYPDKTSSAWLYSDAELIENESFHGPFTAVMALDLPVGLLPVGTGQLQVTTSANYNGIIPGINGTFMDLEILPATATSPDPSDFTYRGFGGTPLPGDLNQLTALPRLQFRPAYTGYDDVNTYGAVEIKIGINKSGIPESDFNIIVDDKVGTKQTRNVHTVFNAKRFETTVYFISHTGELQYSDVNFSIISQDLQDQFETGVQNVATDVTINSVTWYDINGNIDTGGPAIQVFNLTGT